MNSCRFLWAKRAMGQESEPLIEIHLRGRQSHPVPEAQINMSAIGLE
jgi:hypothetical protein